jgi:hypothetical protein
MFSAHNNNYIRSMRTEKVKNGVFSAQVVAVDAPADINSDHTAYAACDKGNYQIAGKFVAEPPAKIAKDRHSNKYT